MANTFIISDPHFGHDNMYTWGIRPWTNREEAEAIIVSNWNKTVNKNDRIYVCGDVAIRRQNLSILSQLNGDKVLIRGNHDIFKLKDYAQYFRDIRGTHKLDRCVLSHYPIHRGSIADWMLGNIHGHTHENRVLDADGNIDKLYFNVCVECIDYTPISYECVRKCFVEAGNDRM
jgi:calcineurin-like phosphoesterase family protein